MVHSNNIHTFRASRSHMTTSDPITHFADALAVAQSEISIGQALHQLADAIVGIKLFT